MPETADDDRQPRLLVVLKGYPRISETFIAQELFGLQESGLRFQIVSLRKPYDRKSHPIHHQITAPVLYLPEYLHLAPLRVLKGFLAGLRRPGFPGLLRLFMADLRRDPTRNRLRRFGQALVLARETGGDDTPWIYAHFAHTPSSVARYAATLLGSSYSISAHAKDIWTSPDWELAKKLQQARWSVTCTRSGRDKLVSLAGQSPVHLCYHGLDLSRFPSPSGSRLARDGSDPDDPVTILSVGRAVPKKGYDTILAALAALPANLHWRFVHIGSGTELDALKAEAGRLGLSRHIDWRGQRDHSEVLRAYHSADIFTLASRIAANGDRDGLPNVLVEAASQRLACVATAFSAIPEMLETGVSGLLVPPDDPSALSAALARVISDPDLRLRLGQAAENRVREDFDARPGIARLICIFRTSWREDRQLPR